LPDAPKQKNSNSSKQSSEALRLIGGGGRKVDVSLGTTYKFGHMKQLEKGNQGKWKPSIANEIIGLLGFKNLMGQKGAHRGGAQRKEKGKHKSVKTQLLSKLAT